LKNCEFSKISENFREFSIWAKLYWLFFLKNVILELCKGVHCVDLGESFQTLIYLQNLASIQPRTSPLKFAGSRDVTVTWGSARIARGAVLCRGNTCATETSYADSKIYDFDGVGLCFNLHMLSLKKTHFSELKRTYDSRKCVLRSPMIHLSSSETYCKLLHHCLVHIWFGQRFQTMFWCSNVCWYDRRKFASLPTVCTLPSHKNSYRDLQSGLTTSCLSCEARTKRINAQTRII